MSTTTPDPAKVRAGKLGGLTTSTRHGSEHYQRLGRQRQAQVRASTTPASRKLWSLRMNQLRGKTPAERAKLRAKWAAATEKAQEASHA